MTAKSQPPSNKDINEWIKTVQENPSDKKTSEKIVLHYTRLVRSLARKYARNQMIQEELTQVGMIGLLGAIKRFDVTFNKPFEAFAIPTILGEIKRYIRDKTWSVNVPRRIKELGPKIKKAVDVLTEEKQRSPTIQEIATYLEVSEEEVLETMEMGRSYHAISVDRQREANSDGSKVSLLDVLGKGDAGFEKVQLKMLIEDLLPTLTEREQRVLHYIYFENLSQAETGERIGVSQMHVSRIQRRSLKKLRAVLQETDVGL